MASFEKCLVCFKGDTHTAIKLQGEPEFVIAAIARLGLVLDDAEKIVYWVASTKYGCDYGRVPVSDMDVTVLLCPACAKRAGVEVREGGAVMRYRQPEATRRRPRNLHVAAARSS